MFCLPSCSYRSMNLGFELQSKSGEYQKPFRLSQDHELFDRLSSLLVTGLSIFFSHYRISCDVYIWLYTVIIYKFMSLSIQIVDN